MAGKAKRELPNLNQIVLLLTGHGTSAMLSMARNLLLARLIGLEDYGLAMAVATTLATVELVTHLGLPQQMVSRRDGALPRVQAALHGAQMARGAVGALTMLALAWPMSALLAAPDLIWLLSVSALSPLCLGLSHLDAYRAQRHRRHLPAILLLVVPSAVSVVMLWPLSHWMSGPALLLGLIAAHSLATTALSHVLTTRRYTLAWPKHEAARILRYGLPLAGNGVLLCAVLHLEKLIAGQVLGMSALALVAMGAGLTMTPALTAARSFQSYHLPRLRRSGAHPEATRVILEFGCLAGALLALALSAAAPWVARLAGPDFDGVTHLLPVFVVLAALRLPKSALATIALASGRTHIPLLANAPRLLAAPLLWWVLSHGGDLRMMLLCAVAAEAFGLLTGLYACRKTIVAPRLELFAFALICALLLAGQGATAGLVLMLGTLQAALGRYSTYRGTVA